MNIPADAWQVIGAIFAGLVAGLVSFMVTILTKEQKTSEFRQSWIDALRQDLSDFAATCISLTDSLRLLAEEANSTATIRTHLLKERYPEVKQIEATRTRILLRLNPKEHKKLTDLIDRAYSYSAARDEKVDPSSGERLVAEFIAESQDVLKREWRRVKRGETVFWVTKWLSLLAFVVCSAAAVAYWRGHFVVTYAANPALKRTLNGVGRLSTLQPLSVPSRSALLRRLASKGIVCGSPSFFKHKALPKRSSQMERFQKFSSSSH